MTVKKIKVIIVDDHPVFQKGLLEIIKQDPQFEIVGQCSRGRDVFPIMRDKGADIVILDISLPDISGLEVLKMVRKANFPTEIIILTMYKEEEFISTATHYDARGFLFKDNTPDELLKCLHAVSKGKNYYSADVSDKLIDHIQKVETLHLQFPKLTTLTAAQQRILKLISENKTSREIAEELFLSIRTVQNQRNKICQKLGLRGYHKLLQFAFEHKEYL